MRADEIRRFYDARPFKPFTLRVADGRDYTVDHPEFLAFSVSGRAIVVATPDDAIDVIDTMMVTSIHLGDGKRPRRRRK